MNENVGTKTDAGGPGSPGMRVVLSAWALREALRRGALAAVNGRVGSIRITARNGEIAFDAVESGDAGVPGFASRHVVKVAKGSMAAVEAEGEAYVLAEQLKDVVSRIPSAFGVRLQYADQLVEPDIPSIPEALKVTLPDGLLSVGVIRKGRLIGEVHIESFPEMHFAAAEYPDVAGLKVIVSGRAEVIREACVTLRSIVNQYHHHESFRNVAMFDGGDRIHFMGADSHQCAIATVRKTELEQVANFGTEENGRPIPVLIPVECLKPILAAAAGGDVLTIATDEAGEHLHLFCGASSYRIVRPGKDLAMEYPDYRALLSMSADAAILINRREWLAALDMMRQTAEGRIKCVFSDSEGSVRMQTTGIQMVTGGTIPYVQGGGIQSPIGTVFLHATYVRNAIAGMRARNVRITFSADGTKFRIEDETDPRFAYFSQTMSPCDE